MPEIPTVNPNIDGSTVDPKWIDGGPHNVAPTYRGPNYNIDNPYLWPTLSVLSGLASGYCERRAVFDPTFITGETTTVIEGHTTTNYVYTTWGGAASTKIASNMANNMAIGSVPPESMFYSANAYMYPPGEAGTSNYMAIMDNNIAAIAGLFVDEHEKPYLGGFDTVAQSAAARAHQGQESINPPVEGGGTLYNVKDLNAFPVDWARERKWVLDELRYVDPCGNIRNAMVDPKETEYTSGRCERTVEVTGGTIDGGTAVPVYNDEHTEIISARIDGGTVTPFVATVTGITYDQDYPYNGTGASYDNTAYINTDNFIDPVNWINTYNIYKFDTAITGKTAAVGEVSYYIDVAPEGVFAAYGMEATNIDYYNEDDYTIYVADTRVAIPDKSYYVLPGGTLIKPGGRALNKVTVESGGTLVYGGVNTREPNTYYYSGEYVKYPGYDNVYLMNNGDDGTTGTGGLDPLPDEIPWEESIEDGEITWAIYNEDRWSGDVAIDTLYIMTGAIIKPYVMEAISRDQDPDVSREPTPVIPIIAEHAYYDYHTLIMHPRASHVFTNYTSWTEVGTLMYYGENDLYVDKDANVILGGGEDYESYYYIYVAGGTVTIQRNCSFDGIVINEGAVVNIVDADLDPSTGGCDVHVMSGGVLNCNTADIDIDSVYVYSGGTLNIHSDETLNESVYIGSLVMFDGAIINGYYNMEAERTLHHYIGQITLGHFDTLGMIAGTTAGWMYPQVTIVDSSTAVNNIYGADDPQGTEAQDAIEEFLTGGDSGDPDMYSGRITCDMTVAGTSAVEIKGVTVAGSTNAYDIWEYREYSSSYDNIASCGIGESVPVEAYCGTRIPAINKQGGPPAYNYYPSFYCRQFYTDPGTPEPEPETP